MDFGTDSVRAVVIDAEKGTELANEVAWYKRWAAGKYCDPAKNMFRQHPRDYIEGMEPSVKGALAKVGKKAGARVVGIGIDTTGSTPCAVDRDGTPLALTKGFEENPNAMFVLWKDHTAVREAELINKVARTWGGTDFTRYEGGVYSSEWFWSKILHVLREDAEGPRRGLLLGGALRLDAGPPDGDHGSADHEAQPVRGRAQGHVAPGLGRPSPGAVPRQASTRSCKGLRARLFTETLDLRRRARAGSPTSGRSASG